MGMSGACGRARSLPRSECSLSAATVEHVPVRTAGRAASFAIVAGVYLVALAVAVGVGAAVGTGSPLLTVLAADVAATIVVFIASRATDNTSMYDAYWSAVPPVVVLFFVQVAEPGVPVLRQVLVVALVWAWAVRLTANWARGWPGIGHEDWRYGLARDNGRPYWLQSFFGFHLFPTLQVYLGCLPLYAAVSVGTIGIGVFDVVATVVTGGAIVLEMVADEQLRAFNRTKSPGDICTVGLWAWCRHPNYLGELSFWWGLWLFGLAADPGVVVDGGGTAGHDGDVRLRQHPHDRHPQRGAAPGLRRPHGPGPGPPPPQATTAGRVGDLPALTLSRRSPDGHPRRAGGPGRGRWRPGW